MLQSPTNLSSLMGILALSKGLCCLKYLVYVAIGYMLYRKVPKTTDLVLDGVAFSSGVILIVMLSLILRYILYLHNPELMAHKVSDISNLIGTKLTPSQAETLTSDYSQNYILYSIISLPLLFVFYVVIYLIGALIRKTTSH